MCWILSYTDNLFPFTRDIIAYFVNYYMFFGIFGLSIITILYYATKEAENVFDINLRQKSNIILYLIYIVFVLLVPVYILTRMLLIAFDLEYTIEVSSGLYSVVLLLFSYVRKRIFG